MGQTLAERIQYEAAYDRNLIFQAYAGDLADLVGELQARAERAEAALAERDDSYLLLRLAPMHRRLRFHPNDIERIATPSDNDLLSSDEEDR